MKLGLGRSKQKEQLQGTAPGSVVANRLRELCGDDPDLYGAMSRLMFLDPKKITTPIDGVLREAQEHESHGNMLRAEVGYRIAGGISLFKGDVDGVSKYFSKAASFAGNFHSEYQTILKRTGEAVAIARKYYEEFNAASP